VSATLTTTLAAPNDEGVARVREALADQGFGVLTEIDIRATFKAKLDVDVAPQVILGACMPQLAHRALTAAPSVAALLPCNVVVRELEAGRTLVEAVDPDAMMTVVPDDSGELAAVAADARTRLEAALASLEED
jgi:uncharacterized protein (DUF302 family)